MTHDTEEKDVRVNRVKIVPLLLYWKKYPKNTPNLLYYLHFTNPVIHKVFTTDYHISEIGI